MKLSKIIYLYIVKNENYLIVNKRKQNKKTELNSEAN